MPVDNAFIPLCVPQLAGNEWAYIKDCLDTNWVSSVGSYVDRFETMVAAATDSAHAIAVCNGTAALQVALQLAAVAPGDEVIVNSLTFIASANAIRYLGAWPVFIDVADHSWQLDIEQVEIFLRTHCQRQANGELRNIHTGRRVTAIMPVHLLGAAAPMSPLLQLAREFELEVVEDAAEALGTRYAGQAVGSFGRLGCLSFNGNKLLTTGGGGMIITADAQLAARARHLTTQAKADPREYIHDEIGYNYRLTNIQAAMGVAQMEALPQYVQKKRAIAQRYTTALATVPGLRCLPEPTAVDSTFWLYSICIDAHQYGLDSRQLQARLEAAAIQTRPLWQPLHLSPAHRGAWHLPCPVAEKLFAQTLSLPCSVGLTEAQQQRVIDAVISFARS